MKYVELLSPAGDLYCLRSAIAAGADAVYGGGKDFSARAFAGNFSSDELLYAIDLCHLYGRRFHLTVNTLIKDKETDSLLAMLAPLAERGLDAVILQDIGLLKLIRLHFPHIKIHVSTQAAVMGPGGAKLFSRLGAERIILARELSLDEIRNVCEKSPAEVECFIHGSMCYAYSGLCLMSSLLGGRSGNRGRCAGPCRQPYSLRHRKDKGEWYPLSMKDLCLINFLPDLVNAGVKSLKIEGRMKSPEYVGTVTGIYRKYLNLCLSDRPEPYSVDASDLNVLKNLYARGGEEGGYLYRHNGAEMITGEKGCYRTSAENAIVPELPPIPMQGSISLSPGHPLALSLSSKGKKVEVFGAAVEAASNRPLSKDDILRQLNKTGNSEFKFHSLQVSMDSPCFVPLGALKALRRTGIEKLKEALLNEYRHPL
ncbi:MAG: U32 family peptidase [Lachnospiraceae bacterium]|nr:U32 family peptidase [Lachnospiraceae bacterium]